MEQHVFMHYKNKIIENSSDMIENNIFETKSLHFEIRFIIFKLSAMFWDTVLSLVWDKLSGILKCGDAIDI